MPFCSQSLISLLKIGFRHRSFFRHSRQMDWKSSNVIIELDSIILYKNYGLYREIKINFNKKQIVAHKIIMQNAGTAKENIFRMTFRAKGVQSIPNKQSIQITFVICVLKNIGRAFILTHFNQCSVSIENISIDELLD